MLKTALKIGYAMDAVRLWPRVFVAAYLWELTRVIEWYIAEPAKGWDIAAFVTAYATLCVPLLKWYMENGIDWTQFTQAWFKLPVAPAKPAEPA